MISLSQVLGKDVDFNWTVPVLCGGISEYFGVKLRTRALTREEEQAIRQIQKERYANPGWTFGAWE